MRGTFAALLPYQAPRRSVSKSSTAYDWKANKHSNLASGLSIYIYKAYGKQP